MSDSVKPIPTGQEGLIPHLVCERCSEAIEFYKKAFGAKERYRIPGPDGKSIGHAEIVIGDSILMLADEAVSMAKSPQTLGEAGVSMLLYVKDVDKAFQRAVAAGAKVKEPVENKFYGERAGSVTDPFGHLWTLMTHIEDVTVKEVIKRAAGFGAKMGAPKEG